MRTSIALGLALLGALVARGHAGEAAAAGGLSGRVTLGVDGVKLADVGPVVVFLDGVDGELQYEVPSDVPKIGQKNAVFTPSFLVVTRGQTVEAPNDDSIFHNVFSYSKPSQFDLGLYPKGDSRRVTFKEAGVVRLYCSIHESMSATVFVAPSPYHAVVDGSGAFAIRGVPAGRYRLRTWNQKLPDASREVEVPAGGEAHVDLAIGAKAAER